MSDKSPFPRSVFFVPPNLYVLCQTKVNFSLSSSSSQTCMCHVRQKSISLVCLPLPPKPVCTTAYKSPFPCSVFLGLPNLYAPCQTKVHFLDLFSLSPQTCTYYFLDLSPSTVPISAESGCKRFGVGRSARSASHGSHAPRRARKPRG